MIPEQWIQWRSPTSCCWSKYHLDTKDWMVSDPRQRVTVCGRRPYRQRVRDMNWRNVMRSERHMLCSKCWKGSKREALHTETPGIFTRMWRVISQWRNRDRGWIPTRKNTVDKPGTVDVYMNRPMGAGMVNVRNPRG